MNVTATNEIRNGESALVIKVTGCPFKANGVQVAGVEATYPRDPAPTMAELMASYNCFDSACNWRGNQVPGYYFNDGMNTYLFRDILASKSFPESNDFEIVIDYNTFGFPSGTPGWSNGCGIPSNGKEYKLRLVITRLIIPTIENNFAFAYEKLIDDSASIITPNEPHTLPSCPVSTTTTTTTTTTVTTVVASNGKKK